MQSALRLETVVLPGQRIEISDPGLPEGARVDVIVVLPASRKGEQSGSMLSYLDSLPAGPRSAKTWDEIEKQIQTERDGWEN